MVALMGKQRYSKAKQLLITANGGGSKGYLIRLWKWELQKLANETGISISVCHFPPEQVSGIRLNLPLFSFITQNWRGKPLVSHEVIVKLIAATTTGKGLKVRCELDSNKYQKGIKVSDKKLALLC